MSEKYVIQWKSKVNGRAGKGAKLFDRGEAEQLVAELNEEYPDIQHEAVLSNGLAQTGSAEGAELEPVSRETDETEAAASNPNPVLG